MAVYLVVPGLITGQVRSSLRYGAALFCNPAYEGTRWHASYGMVWARQWTMLCKISQSWNPVLSAQMYRICLPCVPLMSASPSLALSTMGERLWLSSTYFASAQPVLGLHMWPSPMSPRARWERGARSPLAPTVPCSGTQERQEAAGGRRESYNLIRTTNF